MRSTDAPVGAAITPDPSAWEQRTVLRQRWAELAYFHWSYEPEDVQRLLPVGVTVDTFDGRAWVGLIPFEMRNVQIGSTPPLPWLGSFIEVNVRTYVIDPQGRRSVWFFSLDVPRSAIVAVARSVFSLPYCWADATHQEDGGQHRYQVARRWPRQSSATADIRFSVGSRLDPDEVSELDHFLSARWGLVTRRRNTLLHGRVDHERWPLHRVDDVQIDESLVAAAGLPAPTGPPLALYSPGVDVQVAWFKKLTNEESN